MMTTTTQDKGTIRTRRASRPWPPWPRHPPCGRSGPARVREGKGAHDSVAVVCHHRVAPTKRPYDGWMIVFVIVMGE
jgi:hypothetical protein